MNTNNEKQEKLEFVRVSEAIASAILERERVRPTYLHRNEDNSITAIFDDIPAPAVRGKIAETDPTLVVLDPLPVENRQPNVEANIAATVRFAFIEQPQVDLTDE